MTSEVRLSSTEFKALSSDTRTQILKMLSERNYTLSELSSKINLSMPTIKQHMNVLVDSDLVELIDEGRKWKYYSLSKKGRKISSPEQQVNIFIVLSFATIAVVGVLFILISSSLISPQLGLHEKTVSTGLPSTPAMEKGDDAKAGVVTVLSRGMDSSLSRLSYADQQKALDKCKQECDDCDPFKGDCTKKCYNCINLTSPEP